MSKKSIDFDAVERVTGKELPTDIHGLAQLVARVFVELNRQVGDLQMKVDGLAERMDRVETILNRQGKQT